MSVVVVNYLVVLGTGDWGVVTLSDTDNSTDNWPCQEVNIKTY